jgi:hypothetical protein
MDLNYNTMNLPVQSKNSRSISENPDFVREKIFKEIDWSKSDGETLSNRNALLMSVFANFPPLPILLIIVLSVRN